MTRDEIKSTTRMSEVLSKYGIKVNRGMCSCPFHGKDKHPSMQVFNDGYKCHTCGEYGDIFSFVMKMEGCGFKDAFKILGGEYEHSDSRSSKIRRARWEAERQTKERQAARLRKERELNNILIAYYRRGLRITEPMSDEWAKCMHAFVYQLYLHEELNG